MAVLPLEEALGALGEVAYMAALAWCGVALWRSVARLEMATDTTLRRVVA